MAYPYIVQGNNITVVIDNKIHTFSKTHVCFERLKEAIKTDDWDGVKDLIEPKKAVLNYGKGHIEIQGENLFWKGEAMHNALATKIVEMLRDGFPIEPMVLFMENLMQNPSRRAVTELYGFLEKGELPITPDGHFLAYKRVRDTYFDVHSNSVLNKPANLMSDNEVDALPLVAGQVAVDIEDGVTVVTMERNAVDDDKDRTCSSGLHFCSKDYLGHFGGERIMILKINPRDVVSIPSDYNDSKGRACRYEVIGELGVNPDEAFTKPVQDTAAGSTVVKRETPAVSTVKTAAPKQEYDSRGRPLSMSPDAIRRREFRRRNGY